MFDQTQIAEFKEAFSMFDHDSDGFVDREDLKDMLASLGILFCDLNSLPRKLLIPSK
jgi:Ca2+-binding EF-hand superfamily protein